MATNSDDLIGNLIVRNSSATNRVKDVVIRDLVVNRDQRGTLTELLRKDWPDLYGDTNPFAQMYASVTAVDVARDEDKWHVHRQQTDRFYCLAGQIVVAIADPRTDSPTRGEIMLVEMTASADAPAPLVVTVPPGTLHGFLVTSTQPAMLANFPNRLYDPSDEGRVGFADADVTVGAQVPFSWDLVRRHYAAG